MFKRKLIRGFIVLLAVMLLPIAPIAQAAPEDEAGASGTGAFSITPKFLHINKHIQIKLPSAELPAKTNKFPAIPYYNKDASRYRITVDSTNNVCSIWEKTGSTYDKLVKRFLVTTGASNSQTPVGNFTVDGFRQRLGGFAEFTDTVYYMTHIVRNIYFHSVLYRNSAGTVLDQAAFKNLGRSTSHGCIRMLVENCQWIYYNCPPGTQVRIFKGAANSTAQNGLPKPAAGSYKVPSDPNPWPTKVYATMTATVNARDSLGSGATKFTAQKGDKVQVLMYDAALGYAKITKNGSNLGYCSANVLSIIPY